jgi:2-hydroxychromene-2-carboxylate isomerase
VTGVDASDLDLDFYPSLNSPYTAIIYDKTIEMAKSCGIRLHHKPVLPMVMRGLPVPRTKGMYIVHDTKREAEDLQVDFGPAMAPVGEPVRKIYSLLPWARDKGRDTALLSAALHLAWGRGVGLHRRAGLRAAVEAAGLSWAEAETHLGSEDWKVIVAANQDEMRDALDLWGVPSYRLRGGGAEDLSVWGQDRLWLVAAEIRRRAG